MFVPKKLIKKSPINSEYYLENFDFDNVATALFYSPTYQLKQAFSLFLLLAGSVLMLFKVIVPMFNMHIDSLERAPILSPTSELSNIVIDTKNNTKFSFIELKDTKRAILSRYQDLDLPQEFYISIPSLNIKDAVVKINSTDYDPKNALGHYKGSCLPGDGCNAFIFGHSTYEGAINRYEKGDYTAIFSKLNNLNYGDEFNIKFNDKEYRYIVQKSKIEKPKNIDPLSDPYPTGTNKSSVTLFTCDPPGTTINRLLVTAMLVE